MSPDICEYEQGSVNISCSYDDHAGASEFTIGQGEVKHAINVNSDKFIKFLIFPSRGKDQPNEEHSGIPTHRYVSFTF